MVKHIFFYLIFLTFIGCAAHDVDGQKPKILKQTTQKNPLRIKNQTSHTYERTHDDKYKIKLKIKDKSLLKGNFYAEALIDGFSHTMEYSGGGEFVYYHQVGCAPSFEVQFKIYYSTFSFFPSEDVKYDVFLYPTKGAHTIAITPSERQIVASEEKIVFSCKENCEKCFSNNISIFNKGLEPITIREVAIYDESFFEKLPIFTFYLNGITLPASVDCGKGIILSISSNHCGYKSSGILVIRTDNPKQPEIKIPLIGMCAERIISKR